MRIYRVVCFLILGLMPAFSAPDSIKDLRKSLTAKYKGKTVTLRNFYSGSKLLFNHDGNLAMLATIGPWTTCAKVEIRRMDLNDKKLILEGFRILHRCDFKQKGMVEIRKSDQNYPRGFFGPDPFQFRAEIALIKGPGREDALKSAIDKIFLKETEPIADVVPQFWNAFFRRQTIPSSPDINAGFKANNNNPDIVQPQIIRQPMPRYSMEARMFRIEGIILISCVVDKNGKPRDLQIISPLGMGLDESAIDEMSHWQFLPGRFNGQPIEIMINVEVCFRIY
jgi:TonB family protein